MRPRMSIIFTLSANISIAIVRSLLGASVRDSLEKDGRVGRRGKFVDSKFPSSLNTMPLSKTVLSVTARHGTVVNLLRARFFHPSVGLFIPLLLFLLLFWHLRVVCTLLHQPRYMISLPLSLPMPTHTQLG